MKMKEGRRPTGFIFYRGPSMLDGKPIVAILTGLNTRSKNSKTGGGLYQTWIMRSDINPLEAVRLGADVSICGDCKHRGRIVWKNRRKRNTGRTCYVRLDTAPNSIFKAFKRGRYPALPMDECCALVEGGKIRSGSYGDPAAVPFPIWLALLAGLDTGTAYTHQWRSFPELAAFCMASVDTPDERVHAKLLGFRTFRVRGSNDPVGEYEVECPASEEMGHRTTCTDCVACGGLAAKAKVDISIIVHANKDRQFAEATA